MTQPRLAGRRVAVTRGKQGEDLLVERLRLYGAEVLEFPAIAVVPLSPEEARPLDEALGRLDQFDWVVFASGNAVGQTLASMRRTSVPIEALTRRRLAVVGEATAAKLAKVARAPDLVPEQARAESLVEALRPLVKDCRILVPRAEEGRPELVAGLRAAGAEVVAPIAYRSVVAPPESLYGLGELLQNGQLDAVVFASPSAVRSVTAALGKRARWLDRTLVAAIGPTTADAVRASGFRVDVQPQSATASALADAVAERLDVG